MGNEIVKYFRGWVDHPHLGRRIGIAVTATIVMGFCVLALERLDVGTDPFSAVCLQLSVMLGVDLRYVTIAVHAVTLCIVLFVARDMFGFGSLANMILVGCSHDFFKAVLGEAFLQHTDEGLRIALFAGFTLLFILAVSAYVASGLGTSPYDAAPIIIHRKLAARRPGLSPKVVRIPWDAFFALLAWVLGTVFVKAEGAFGWMTVACVVGLGPVIEWTSKRLARFVN